jgi:hypothetical protein
LLSTISVVLIRFTGISRYVLDIGIEWFETQVLRREVPMYHIKNVSGENAWSVVDVKDRVVFTGTMQQVEDWLDSQENLNRRPSNLSAWFRRLFHTGTRPVDHLAEAARGRKDRVPSL